MQVKRAIKKVVEPELLKFGFRLRYTARGLYCFCNSDKSIDITISVPPLPDPNLLQEYISGYQQKKWIVPPPSLRVSYAVKQIVGYHVIPPSNLTIGAKLVDSIFYLNQQELESAAKTIVEQATTWILPFLNRLVERMVYPTTEMYQQLEGYINTTSPKAEYNSIDGESLKRVLYEAEQSVINLLPDEDSLRETVFMEHVTQVLQLAHNTGNAILRNRAGEWGWMDYKKYNLDVPPVLCVKYSNGDGCNVLQRLIDLWNFYPGIKFGDFK